MISDYRISSSSDFSAASFKAWKIFGEALKFPGPWASPSEAFLLLLEVLPSHRLQSICISKAFPSRSCSSRIPSVIFSMGLTFIELWTKIRSVLQTALASGPVTKISLVASHPKRPSICLQWRKGQNRGRTNTS